MWGDVGRCGEMWGEIHPPLARTRHALAPLPARAPVEDERGVGAHEVRDVPPLREPSPSAAPRVHLVRGRVRVRVRVRVRFRVRVEP